MHAKLINSENTVPFHQRQERSIKGIRRLDLICVLAQEENALVDQIADNEAQDLSQISPGNEFLTPSGQ